MGKFFTTAKRVVRSIARNPTVRAIGWSALETAKTAAMGHILALKRGGMVPRVRAYRKGGRVRRMRGAGCSCSH